MHESMAYHHPTSHIPHPRSTKDMSLTKARQKDAGMSGFCLDEAHAGDGLFLVG
jgi:hypothetical protein